MKKTTKKIYAILLIILMLMNYVPAITNAIEEESCNIVLESTASRYDAGDEILVDIKIDQLINIKKIRHFNARIEYNEEDLRLEKISISEELANQGYSSTGAIANKSILISLFVGDATLGIGSTICTIKFTALKSSDTQTKVRVYDIDATDNDERQLMSEPNRGPDDAYINNPEITLPVPFKQIKHNLQITKTNSNSEAITSDSAIFKITKLDGTIIYQGTDSNGRITLTNLEIPNTTNTYTYIIEEMLAPTGYEKNEEPTIITLTFNEEGKVLTAVAGTNGNASIIEDTNTIDVKISNIAKIPEVEKEVFNLVLNKVDEENRSITSDTAEFVITMPDGTQANYATIQSTGKTENIAILAPETAGTYAYVIKETKAPNGYRIEENSIIVELKYVQQNNKIILESGNVVSYNNEAVIITNDEIKTATVNIKNEQEIINYNYTIMIDKVKNDTFKTNITEDTAIFEIIKGNETSYVRTNQLGKATFEFSMTNKEIVVGQEYTYKVKEIKAPNGYILDEESKDLTLTFNEDGSINTAIVSGQNIIEPMSTTNTVNVKIVNEKEPEEIVIIPQDFKLQINKVDENGQTITTGTTEYIITMPDGTKVEYNTGSTEKPNIKAPEEEGTYIYVIKETKTPEGYKPGKDIILELTFEKVDEKIVLVSGTHNNKEIEITEDGQIKTAKIDVETEKETITYNYSINIDKIDTDNQNITSTDTMFEITKDEKMYYIKTNEEGKAIFTFSMTNEEIIEGQEYIYTIKEIKAPNGYILDETLKTLTLTFNKNGNINTTVVSGENITEPTFTTNIVNVKITNEKEPEEIIIIPQDFELQINKIDQNNNLINSDSANFILTTPDGTTHTLTTVNGISSKVRLNAPKVAGKQIYFLKETKAPQGYDILESSLVIEANFIESEGKIVLSSTKIKEYNKEIIPSDNILTIEVINTKHEEEQQPGIYNIKILGVDRNNNPIENGTTVIKLTNKLTGEYTYKEVQIKDGSMELELPKLEGLAEYELNQIQSAEGYKVNPNTIQITIDFQRNEQGKIEIADYTVSGQDATKGTSDTKNTVSVIIINDEIKIEPQKQNYCIEIDKLDSVTKELITEGSAIFTIVDSKGNTKEYGTTNGKIIISGIVPGNVGESETFIIKEKVAPEGYKLTEETIIVKVTFEELEGKVVITEPELIMGSSISQVEKTEENNIKINIINEKEDEELYVVSKKYANGVDIYDLFTSYTGSHYTIDKPFIDTKEAKYGNNVSVQTFIDNLESNGILTIWDEAGNQVPNGNRVKTGMLLKATKRDKQKTFTIVVKGDSSKDGRVTTVDLNMLERHLTAEKTLTDPIALRAIDFKKDSGDGRITTVDINECYYVLSK